MKSSWLLLPAVLVGLFPTQASAAASQALDDDVFSKQIEKEYDGLFLQVVGKPEGNYRKLGVCFDQPIDLSGYEYLTLSFRNLAAANIPLSFAFQDAELHTISTAYSGSSSSFQTHFLLSEDGSDLSAVSEYYACINMKKDVSGGELLIDLSKLSTNLNFGKADKVFIGLPAAYNLGEKVELLNVGLATATDFSYSSGAFSIPESDIISSIERTPVFDFTEIADDAEYESLLASRKLLKCNQDNAITGQFDQYVESGKAEYSKTVCLKESVIDGIKFSLKSNGHYISGDAADPYYAEDKFGYIRLASSSGVSCSDALALKMASLCGSLALRILIKETDGEVWTFPRSDGEIDFLSPYGILTKAPLYYNCVWPSKGEGTLNVPYALFKQVSSSSSFDCLTGDKALSDIQDVILSFDMAASSQNVSSRKIGIASLADVNYGNEQIIRIGDLTAYSVSASEALAADANFANPAVSGITKPFSSNSSANDNWVLSKPDKAEMIAKKGLKQQWIGDVKVLDNFSIESGDATKEEKDEALASFYETYGEKSSISSGTLDGDEQCLDWKVANYADEYQGLSGGYSGLTISKINDADEWGSWQGSKGLTMRIRNNQKYEASFNLAFQQRYDGKVVSYRMDDPKAAIYALDTKTNEEFSFRAGSVSSFSSGPTIYLPGGFDGWIRIPFDSYGCYSSNDEGVMDLSRPVSAIKFSSYMLDNSDCSFSLGFVGPYYRAFSIVLPFGDGYGIADCLAGEGA